MQSEFKPIKFPEDELTHDSIIEWWYFNGHLKDAKGNNYSFMNCLFKADVKKVNIPFLKRTPLKTIYFAHSLVSDIKNKKFYPKIDYVTMISRDSFSKPLLFVNYINPIIFTGYVNNIIEETNKFKYHIKTENLDLILTAVKKPLLLNKNGYVNLKTKGTYYYSLTNLKTEGTIKIKNKLIKVKGKSWMDHQWANTSYSKKDKWTWFSIQLDNNTEIVCFEYTENGNKTYLADISYPNNKQEHFNKVKLTPLGIKWTGSKTKTVYPLSWKIEIPEKNINLEVKPLIKNQEMLFGTINYWEGPLTVKGFFNNKKVKGVGFLELVGYPTEYTNIKFLKDEAEAIVKKSLPYIKKETRKILHNYKKKVLNKAKLVKKIIKIS